MMGISEVIEKVQDEMRRLGWSDGSAPGSIKLMDGRQVARYGDPTWASDFEESIATVERKTIIAEFERRDAERGSQPST
jgi:hypothetical protein